MRDFFYGRPSELSVEPPSVSRFLAELKASLRGDSAAGFRPLEGRRISPDPPAPFVEVINRRAYIYKS